MKENQGNYANAANQPLANIGTEVQNLNEKIDDLNVITNRFLQSFQDTVTNPSFVEGLGKSKTLTKAVDGTYWAIDLCLRRIIVAQETYVRDMVIPLMSAAPKAKWIIEKLLNIIAEARNYVNVCNGDIDRLKKRSKL